MLVIKQVIINLCGSARANEIMLGCQIKRFTGGGVDLDQSQTFQKSDFPTGREGIGGQDVWD